MENFTADQGTVTFHEVRGTVLSGATGTRTNVSLSGGGGHVGPNGGYVAAPQLHTSSTDVQSLWIRTDEGRDDHFSLVGTTAAVTEGQRVVMVLGKASTSPEYWPVVLVNNNSKRYHPLAGIQSLAAGLVAPANQLRPWFVGLLSFLIGAFFLAAFDGYSTLHQMGLYPMIFGPGLCFLWLLAVRLRWTADYKEICDQLATHVDTQGQAFLSGAGQSL